MGNRVALPQQLRVNMLTSVLEFLHGSGMSDSKLRELFDQSLSALNRRLANPSSPTNGELQIGNENICAELLRVWHRNDRYIDTEAKPRPLPLNRGRDSLVSILRRIDAKVDAMQLLREMKAVRLIRRTSKGTYLPNSESAIVGRLHPLAIDHIAKLVVRLVSTVARNVDPSGKSLSLIERHTYMPDLDWKERKAFAEFTRTQGMACLESVDNWLAHRRLQRKEGKHQRNEKAVPASVHLFAYLGDKEGMAALRGATKRASSSRAKGDSARKTSRSKKTRSARAVRA